MSADKLTWWQRAGAWLRALAELEPAQLRGIVLAAFTLAAAIGLHVADKDQASVLAFIGTALPIVQALWTRRAVFSPATVARTVAAERTAAYDAGVTEGQAVLTEDELDEAMPEWTPDVDPDPGAQPGLGVPVYAEGEASP